MQKYKICRFTPYDEIINSITSLPEDEVMSFIMHNADDYGIYLITLLEEIAQRENRYFWYETLGVLCTFNLHYVDGAMQSSLYYFIKAHELSPNDIGLLNAILDFGEPPEVVLTHKQKYYYATKILMLEPTNKRALKIVKAENS